MTSSRAQWWYLAGLAVSMVGVAALLAAAAVVDGWVYRVGLSLLGLVALLVLLVCWDQHLFHRREALKAPEHTS